MNGNESHHMHPAVLPALMHAIRTKGRTRTPPPGSTINSSEHLCETLGCAMRTHGLHCWRTTKPQRYWRELCSPSYLNCCFGTVAL